MQYNFFKTYSFLIVLQLITYSFINNKKNSSLGVVMDHGPYATSQSNSSLNHP
jgi:hypothetical protein